MNELPLLTDFELVRRVGWALIHSLWQISIVVGIVSLLNLMLAKQRSTVRYLICCVGMLFCVAIPIGTFVMLGPGLDSDISVSNSPSTYLANDIVAVTNSVETTSPSTNQEFTAIAAEASSEPVDSNLLVVKNADIERNMITFDASQSAKRVETSTVVLPLAKQLSLLLDAWLPTVFWTWIVGVIILAFRPLTGILFIRRLRMRGRSSVPEYVSRTMNEACKQLRLNYAVEIAQSTFVEIPSVIGYFNPLVLLPVSAMTGLNEPQLRAIIIHELAHIRRHDYLVNLMQTVVESLLFYHPLLWYLSAQIRVERENCCDDVVLEHFEDRRDYVCALIKLESRGRRHTALAMNATGGSLVNRVRRIANKQNSRPGNTWLAGLIVLALLALVPIIRSARVLAIQSESVAKSTGVVEDPTPIPDTIKVKVVNQAEEPIENARVEIRIGDEGKSVRTDKTGTVKFDLPIETPNILSIHVSKGAFIPLKAEWDNRNNDEADPIPSEFTFRVGPGIQITGKVIDGSSNPISGATIKPYSTLLQYRTERAQHDWADLRTDENGRWSYEHVPSSLGRFDATITHPDFANDSMSFDVETTEIHFFTMKNGVTVRGTITDPNGNRLANTQVVLAQKWATPGSWATRTNEQGEYQFTNVKPDECRVTVAHKDFSPKSEKIRDIADDQTVDLQMQPGTPILFQFVDENNQPLYGVRVVCRSWLDGRGLDIFEDAIPQMSDANGNWAWKNAPKSNIGYDFEMQGRMSRKFLWLGPRDEPYKYVMYPVLEVSGSVTSKSTGNPIPEFTVTRGNWKLPGFSRSEDLETGGGIAWDFYNARTMINGRYKFHIDKIQDKHYVKIEAPGHKPAVSRAFNDSEAILTFDFQLEESKDNAGWIVDQNGQPIKDALVIYVLPGRLTEIRNSSYEANGLTDTISDADGRFRLPEQDQTYAIMVIADQGYAYLVEDEFKKANRKIKIESWTTIRGTCKIGGQAAAGESVTMFNKRSGDEPENLLTSFMYHGEVEKDGSYRIMRVPPNLTFTIGRQINIERESGGMIGAHSHTQQIETKPGEVVEVNIGGTGRPLVGKVKMPDANLPVKGWNEGLAYLQRVSTMGDEIHQYHFNINDDGSFRVEDLPAGEYFLQVFASYNLGGNDIHDVARIMKYLTIPQFTGERSDKAFDLGTMELELQSNR